MPSRNYEIVRAAIRNKQIVIATSDNCRREMCPHAIGLNRKGEEQAMFYQFAGRSNSGLPPGGEWRCIPIAKLRGIDVQDGPWRTGTGHSKPQTCVFDIDEEV